MGKLELLLDEVNNFEIAMKIRSYVNYVQQKDIKKEKLDWVAWANNIADWYDPTLNKNDSIFGIRKN